MKIIIIDNFWTVICLATSSILILFAVLVTRSKIKYANQLREAQARGAFKDMNTPEYKSRTRHFALIALIGLLGMVLSFVIMIFQQVSGVTNFSGFTAIVALLFGILSSVGGYLMKREIDRRL
jgi:FtsH-binding integral membrane protein